MLASTCWEVPLPGVREAGEAVIVQLLELGGIEKVEGRWSAVLHGVSWRAKSKYLWLKVLAPRIGRAALLDALEGGIIHGLLLGTGDPRLAPAATAAYVAVLARIDLDEWTSHCLPPIATALNGTNRRLAMNVLNYWVLPTANSLPDSLLALLLATKASIASAMVRTTPEAETTCGHAAYLHMLKISRKNFGLWDAAEQSEEVAGPAGHWAALRWALRHSDAWVRGLALRAVCTTARPAQAVAPAELEAVLRFVEANARGDDTRLRHTLLEGVEDVLGRVRAGLRPLLARPAGDTEANADLAAAARFLAGLHARVLAGLRPGTNYQHRVTCLGVYRLLLLYLGPARVGLKKEPAATHSPHSDVLQHHLQLDSPDSRKTLFDCVMDPTDDIRAKAAEILCMLGDGPAETLQQPPTWDHVFALCNSQLFFQVESGAVLGSVLCAWKEDCVDPATLVTACELQLSALSEDVLAAASGGSPLHGLLGLVRRLLASRLRDLGPGRWAGTEDRLLCLLEENVELCLSLLARRASSDSAFAPSFAEMGEAIESMVSRHVDENTDSDLPLKLSPAYQLVLNCIWLNLKVSCGLASDLAELHCQWRQDHHDQKFAERCARLSVTVLTRCRHKGAIESAGVALQQTVKALTDHPDYELRQIPHKLLLEFLHLLLEGSTAKGTSISRRSAGMAILVHRLVLGDQQHDKPLLHECIFHLFTLLEESPSETGHGNTHHDLPQTQALHFLRTLVADATLRVPMSSYLGQAALICFCHLNSPVWSVRLHLLQRNASLQLFGALVPKIVGEGKSIDGAEENDEESIVGCIDFAELAVRFKPLCNLLIGILENVPANINVLQNHAKLIPALSLLARLSVTEVTTWVHRYVQRFKLAFLQLLSSPIATVRSTAAKAYSRFTPIVESASAFEELFNTLQAQVEENGRSGLLTAMKSIKDCLQMDRPLMKHAHAERLKIEDLIDLKLSLSRTSLASYATHAILITILNFKTVPKLDFQKVLNHTSSLLGHTHVGINQWISENFKQIVTNSSISLLPRILDESLIVRSCGDIPRISLLVANKRLHKGIELCVLQDTLNVCLNHAGSKTLSNYDTFHLLSFLLKLLIIAKDMNLKLVCDMSSVTEMSINFLSSQFGIRCEAAALPVISALIMFYFEHQSSKGKSINLSSVGILQEIIKCLQHYSCPDKYDEHFRVSAAKALPFIGASLTLLRSSFSNEMSLIYESFSEMASSTLQSAIQLLQDEDSSVREEASKFVIDISEEVQKAFNALECLGILFTYDFLKKFLGTELLVMHFLWKVLLSREDTYKDPNSKEVENPFNHGTSNIFYEEIWVIELAGSLMVDILKNNPTALRTFSSKTDFEKSCGTIQGEIRQLKQLCHVISSSKVREEWQVNAVYLQKRRMEYRFQILNTIDCEVITPNLSKSLTSISLTS